MIFKSVNQMIVARILHPDSNQALVGRNEAALSRIEIDIVCTEHEQEQVAGLCMFDRVAVLRERQMASAHKREIAVRTLGTGHRNQAVFGERAISQATHFRVEFNFADQFGRTKNHQLFGTHKAVCTLGRIFLEVVRRYVMVAQQFQIKTKSHQRQRVSQGTAVTAIDFCNEVTAVIPEERRHLLIARPVVLHAKFKRHHLNILPVSHLGFRNGPEHAKELRVSFDFGIMQPQFQPNAFVREESTNVEEPRNRVHQSIATDMARFHGLRIKATCIDSV